MTMSLFALHLFSILFAAKRLARYLRFLQQDGYCAGRFLTWFWKNWAFDKWGSIGYLFFGAPALLALALFEKDPRKMGKLPLVMTPRASRIYALALLLYVGVQFLPLYQIVKIQVIPFILLLSLWLLSFDEARRERKLIAEAVVRPLPYTIGITGSYGKTSTADALTHILNTALGKTFSPPKGTNTLMGIVRALRQRRGYCDYAVIEMAAYGCGSIKRLCELTPPQAAIITGVGLAHLERFGDQETIYRAKSELAEAATELLVCNGDNAGSRKMGLERGALLYGFRADCDCVIEEVEITGEGSHFTLCWRGRRYPGRTQLLGKHALSNIAAAFTMACSLGADPHLVMGAIACLKPVDNRLELYKEDGRIYLRDGYNSNPEGFAAALEVLGTTATKKKILMTPGMVELSTKSKELHEMIAERAAAICDLIIIVGKENRESFKCCRGKVDLREVDGRAEAFTLLKKEMASGDAVLIENDLPDWYESRERF